MSTWLKLLQPAQRRFRVARARQIDQLVPGIAEMNVVDLGGSLHFWEVVGEVLKPKSLTILNIAHDGQSLGRADRSQNEKAQILIYDGRHIPAGDKEIDLLICNSVIEHVPPEQRAGLAAEIERVAKAYVIQTPALEFPIEPHFVAPFLHWLPRSWARRLAPLTPFGFIVRASAANTLFEGTSLLSRKSFQRLFPSGRLLRERFCGLVKSYTIYKPLNQAG